MKPDKARRFAVVRAAFNEPITRALLGGAMRGFAAGGVRPGAVDRFDVPGSFELPLAALWLANTGRYGAIVCLGCVIRGETPHFEYVARECARGISSVALATGVPVIFGVLTADTVEQAWARASKRDARGRSHLGETVETNKGYEAARAALAMARVRSRIAKPTAARR